MNFAIGTIHDGCFVPVQRTTAPTELVVDFCRIAGEYEIGRPYCFKPIRAYQYTDVDHLTADELGAELDELVANSL